MTNILPIEDQAARSRAVELIRAGGVVIFPTDTFYALGADPFNRRGLETLYRLKGRPSGKPVLLLVADPARAFGLWGETAPEVGKLAERFWPGPLTIVAPPGPRAPALPGGRGLALRVPGNPLTRALLAELGGPLTGTSANPAGHPPPRTAMEAAEHFPEAALALDGGTYRGDAASTLVEVTREGLVVLREGSIPVAALGIDKAPEALL